MKTRLLLLSLFIAVVGQVWAQGPNGSGTYYQNANGKKGVALKKAMGDIIRPHTDIGYGGLWEAYKQTDTRSDGYVRDWYSKTTNYRHITDKAGSYSREGDCYNREHTVPQSWFNESSPMKADIVHVVPTDGYVNNKRSNYPFAEVANITYQSNQGYCKLGSCKSTGYSGTVFEPNDEIKGDIARIYFYMATCYYSQCGNWGGDIFTSSGMVDWEMNVMKAWSKLDPVDDIEIARNNAVKDVQGNRNPFVDYPGLEDYIWGDKTDVAFSYDNYAGGGQGGETTTVAMPTFSPDAGTYYNSVTVSISSTTEGATIYYTTDGAEASEQSVVYTGSFEITETSTIKAVAIKDGKRSAQAEATYTITDEPVVPQPGGSIEIALNNAFFGLTSTGTIAKSNSDDLVGVKEGITVNYALGDGNQRYANDAHIRIYAGNTLTVSVAQGVITEIEFVTANTGKTLQASVGTVNGYKWTGNNQSIEFSVNEGSGNLQVTSIKVTIPASGPSSIDNVQTTSLSGKRVIYNLRGQRVANPTRGIYIVDGRKVVIGE
ncbi:MAG: endonuclease [Prevotella sp.]|nr:endonuclease [Prevotella sp.]